MVINAIEPWLSSADIDKGSRWAAELSARLEISKAGIVCMTPSNLHAEWILFEAGALSKTIKNTFVCPLLIDLKPTDVKGPLAQFQAVRATDKKEVWGLVQTLNNAQEKSLPEKHLESAFEMWWPKLKSQLSTLPEDGALMGPQRTDHDLLEEILELVRSQSRSSALSIRTISDEDRLMEMSDEVGKVVRTTDVSAVFIDLSFTETDLYLNYYGASGRRYKISIPRNIHLEKVADLVELQMQQQLLK